VDRTGSRLCPLVGFDVSSVEPSSFTAIELVCAHEPSVIHHCNEWLLSTLVLFSSVCVNSCGEQINISSCSARLEH